MNSMKRQKDMTPEDEPPRLEGIQYNTGKSRGQLPIAPICQQIWKTQQWPQS